MRHIRRLPAALIWPGLVLLYLLLPGHSLGLLTGLPLGTLGLGLGLVVTLGAWCGARPRGRQLGWVGLGLALTCGVKLALGALALPYGLTASYATGADPAQSPERSTEWRLESATRVDYSLDFVGDRFPLHFFNDLRRFNFYTASQPRRDRLPFAATWRGWLAVPTAGERCFRLRANGSAALTLGELPEARVERASHVETRDLCGSLEAGSTRLELRYSRPEGGMPAVSLAELRPDGEAAPLPPARLLRAPVSSAEADRGRLLGRLAWGLDTLVAAASLALAAAPLFRFVPVGARFIAPVRGRSRPWSGSGAIHCAPTSDTRQPDAHPVPGTLHPSSFILHPSLERPLLSLAVLASFAEALVVHGHFAGRTPILSGGNDWLAYESYARDVLLSGPLMTGGKPLGEGEPFYYQPLYAYFLAGLHVLLGESVYGLLLAQYVLVAVAGLLTYFLARELLGRPAAVAAFGLFWALRYLIFNQVAGLLLSENLVAIIIPPMLLLLARWPRTWHWADLVGGGVLLGLAILTRSTPLLFLPPALLVLVLATRQKLGHWRPALGAAGVLLAVSLAVFSLAGLRNYLVAGRPVLLPESASTNIYEVHRPTPKVDLSKIDHDPLYDRLEFDRRTREVAEFIRQDPLGYAATLVPMGLYALGVTGPALGTRQVQYELVLLSALYVGGLLFVPAARRAPAWLLHGFVLTHFFQMMVFMSHQYGFRLPLPMYGPMTVVAGATLVGLGGIVRRRVVRGASGSGVAEQQPLVRPGSWLAAAVLLASLWTGWELVRPREVEARVFGLGGSAGPAARAVADRPEADQADRIYFGGQDGRSLGVAYLPGLAYREMKWLDTSRAFVWPADGKRGLLVPSASGGPVRSACIDPAVAGEPLAPLAGRSSPPLFWLPTAWPDGCGPTRPRLASFGGLIDLLSTSTAQAGDERSIRVAWRVVQGPSFRAQPLVEALDASGRVRASAVADPYPSELWEPGETVVAWLPAPAVAQAEGTRLAIGFTRGGPSTRLTIDDPLPLYRQTRVLVDD